MEIVVRKNKCIKSTMINYSENYEIGNLETNYCVPVNFKIARTKKRNFPDWPELRASLWLRILFASSLFDETRSPFPARAMVGWKRLILSPLSRLGRICTVSRWFLVAGACVGTSSVIMDSSQSLPDKRNWGFVSVKEFLWYRGGTIKQNHENKHKSAVFVCSCQLILVWTYSYPAWRWYLWFIPPQPPLSSPRA